MIPFHWTGPRYAPRTSELVASAVKAKTDAEAHLQSMLEREYPLNCRVEVIHYRGRYTGRVSGWDHNGCRVAVTNEATGKTTKWWSAHVQRIEGEQP